MKSTISRYFPASRLLAALALLGGALALPAPGQDAVQPTATLATLPAGILPESPLAQVIKLAQSGVDEGIIQAYITNSPSTFNLNSDKIIYLKDAGVPNDLTTAMMQHDTGLQAQIAAAAPPPTPPPVTPEPPPVPESVTNATYADNSQPGDDITASQPTVAVNYFYDALAPYGNWVQVDGYGLCWQPGVVIYHHDWQPYGDHGHWVYTDSGWYWISDYSWGWAPFHYGRWFRDARFGWCWRPDTIWGPSWVTWRYADDYCGWAPLPPGAEYQDGAGFYFNGGAVAEGYDFGLTPDSFVFVGVNYFCDPHPYTHRLDRGGILGIYQRTVGLNRFDRDAQHGFINYGIDPGRISRVTHVEIRPATIHETSGPVGRMGRGEAVQAGALIVNRPQFQDNHGHLVVDRNRNLDPAWNRPADFNQPPSVAVIGRQNNRPGPAQNVGGYRPSEPYPAASPEPARMYASPENPRPAANENYLPAAPVRYENTWRPPVRQERAEPPHQFTPAPVERVQPLEPPQRFESPPRIEPPQRIEPSRQFEPPQRVEPPPQPRVEPPPAAQPEHRAEPPPAAKSSNDNDQKSKPK